MQKTFATVVFLSLLGCGTGIFAQGLVAHYEFEGEFCDSSGNELHGIPLGDAAIVFDEERDSDVLVLDGAGDTVMLGSDPLFDWTGAFSAAFWMKVEAWQESWDTVLKKESVFSFERNQASEELAFYHWPNFHSTTVGVAANGWHHIAATFDGLEQNTYLDGKLVSTVENTGEMNINSDPVYIGSNGSSRYFNGLVDDVQIYDVALSAEEIEDLAENILIDPGPGPGDPEPAAPQFVRGDSDDNGQLNLTDAVFILQYLFRAGAVPSCLQAGDVNRDGGVNLSDAVAILSYLFLAGEPPRDPFSECGLDAAERELSCESYDGCG